MNAPHDGLDRLLPRLETPFDLEIDWNIVETRRFMGKDTETSTLARVLDLSLDGALVEVPMPTDHQPGEQISIRILGQVGSVKIRHRRLTTTENRMIYGVQLQISEGLREVIVEAVGEIQGKTSRLQRQWERSR